MLNNLPNDPSAATPQDDLGIPGCEDPVSIGQGGFGNVYRCRQPSFERMVAVKVLSTPALDEGVSKRFQSECRAIGALSGHPHIVTVHASGISKWGRPYIVMEYMPGGPVSDLAKGGMGWREASDTGVKLAGAVETAHGAGILHGDIKPENILISGYGEPKLADFGISKFLDGTQTRSSGITASITHAAPELSVSAVADVYSLASTIFQLIYGRPAFSRKPNEMLPALILRITTDPIPDRTEAFPIAIYEVIERAMAKDPADRFQSAAQFGLALSEAQASSGAVLTRMPVLGQSESEPAESSIPLHTPEVDPSSSDAEDLDADVTRHRSRRQLQPAAGQEVTSPRRSKRALVAASILLTIVLGGSAAAFALMGGSENTGNDSVRGLVIKKSPSTSPSPAQDSKPKTTRAGARKVSIRYDKAKNRFNGVVRTPERHCVKGRQIKVIKSLGKKSKVIGRASLDAKGRWTLGQREPDGSFYSLLAEKKLRLGESHLLLCKQAKSKKLAVRAPQISPAPAPPTTTTPSTPTPTVTPSVPAPTKTQKPESEKPPPEPVKPPPDPVNPPDE